MTGLAADLFVPPPRPCFDDVGVAVGTDRPACVGQGFVAIEREGGGAVMAEYAKVLRNEDPPQQQEHRNTGPEQAGHPEYVLGVTEATVHT